MILMVVFEVTASVWRPTPVIVAARATVKPVDHVVVVEEIRSRSINITVEVGFCFILMFLLIMFPKNIY